MAEEMGMVEKPNVDNLEVNLNGVLCDRTDVNSSSNMDTEIETGDLKIETEEPMDTSEHSALEEGPDTTEARSPRGQKRKNVIESDTEEELLGFSPSEIDYAATEQLSKVVARLEAELQAAESALSPAKRPIRNRKPSMKRARADLDARDTTENLSPRPSSRQSAAESDIIAHTSSAEMTSSAASSPASARSRVRSVELCSPAYRLPLERGWRRELVYRAALDSTTKRNADIYYYTPAGKKLRSNREVSEHLAGTGLTTDNFTFFKEPLGVDDPEKEIIRDAKLVRKLDSPSVSSSPSHNSLLSGPREGKRTPKPKPPKGASPERGASTPRNKIKVKSMGSRLSMGVLGSSGESTPPRTKAARKSLPPATNNNTTLWKKPRPALPCVTGGAQGRGLVLTGDGARLLVPPPPPLKYGPAPATPNTNTNTEPPNKMGSVGGASGRGLQPCSMRCAGSAGRVPSLQCAKCLCLYHAACCSRASNDATPFVCSNCSPSTSPSATIQYQVPAQSPQGPVPKVMPKLVRAPTAIPQRRRILMKPFTRPVHTPAPIPTTVMEGPRRVVMKMKMQPPTSGAGGKGVWTVSQSTDTQSISIDPMRLPQTIAFVNGRKFIVVPKHSVANVATAVAAMSSNKEKVVLIQRSDTIAKAVAKELNLTDSFQVKEILPTAQVCEPEGTVTEGGAVVKSEMVEQADTSNNSHTDVEDSPSLKKKKKEKEAEESDESESSSRKSRTSKPKPDVVEADSTHQDQDKVDYFANFYKKSKEAGYNSVLQIFQYLKMREVAAAACVCRLWRELAAAPALWKHVRMKNSQVNDWQSLCAILRAQGTRRLDLRKMLLPPNDHMGFWDQFSEQIATVTTIERMDLCRCPAVVVERLCKSHPNLSILNALAVKCSRLNPTPLAALTQLQELRIKSMSGLSLTADLTPLANLTKLTHLSLTSIKDLGAAACWVVGDLACLESLELGECTFGAEFGTGVLSRLHKLQRLRLERGAADCNAPKLLRALAQLPTLHQLEIINFDIKPGFDDALAECSNIRRLLIIPTYVSQSATTNRQLMSGILRLKDSLTHLMWGVTIELLRVTELFIDQCDQVTSNLPPQNVAAVGAVGAAPGGGVGGVGAGGERKGRIGDSIPVLKPVPGLGDSPPAPPAPGQADKPGPPQVEILPLPSLQKLLNTSLPHTKLKLLRIPFHATWRQSLADFQ